VPQIIFIVPREIKKTIHKKQFLIICAILKNTGYKAAPKEEAMLCVGFAQLHDKKPAARKTRMTGFRLKQKRGRHCTVRIS
jgi:hypothetical protein